MAGGPVDHRFLQRREGEITDPQRPVYHFLAPANWMNDPNGFAQWNGTYHLFYQYNPNAPVWGDIHWGHATSQDLVHWEDQPIALAPTPGGPDEDGCWSGCFVKDEGVPTIIYSGSRGEERLPCLATSQDDLRHWHKYEHNPLLSSPPEGLDLVGFRDHSVWKEGDSWYQVIGAGIKDVGGAVLLYRSADLRNWEYLHPLLVGEKDQTMPLWTGTMWECPDFFPLGDKHVLVLSIWDDNHLHYSVYMVGHYEKHRFYPEVVQKLDLGDSHFYAPQTLYDEQGRRLIMGWITEGRSVAEQVAAGWSGVMSLPRVLTLREDACLTIQPVAELQRLRGEHQQHVGIDLREDSPFVPSLTGDTLEVVAEMELGNADQVALKVRRSLGGAAETVLLYDRVGQRLLIDRTRASLNPETARTMQGGHFELEAGETLKLHLFLDRSVIELFANDHTVLTSRVYPTRPDSQHLAIVAHGGDAYLRSLDIWKMRSIWEEDV